MKKGQIFKRTLFDSLSVSYLACLLLLAVFSPSYEDLLDLSRNVIYVVLFFAFGIAVSWGLNAYSIKTLGEVIFEPAHKKAHAPVGKWFQHFWVWHLIITFVITMIVALSVTKFSIYELTDENGFNGAMRLFSGLLHANLSILPRAVLAIFETIYIAFLATTLAIPIAFVLSFMCAKNIMATGPFGFLIYLGLRTFFNVMRSIEALIWAIIFSVWVGIGPFAGMLALMIHSIASLAKQYSEIVESVNSGPIEGIEATGANRLQMIWFAVVPQIILPYVSFTIYRWDINVRMATIIGLVGGGGIGTMLIQYQGQAMWPEVGCIILVIAIVVWSMDTASAYIREAIK
jgi:phosphonate transport system permease protein